jgi:hypothetical protein
MEGMIPEGLATILRKNRPWCNGLFETARRTGGGLDPDSFLDSFKEAVLPLYAVGEPAAETVLSIYEAVCRLCARELLGAKTRYPLFGEYLNTILARFQGLLAMHAGELMQNVTAGICSALNFLGRDAKVWVNLLSSVPDTGIDLETFRRLGFVCAWVSGIAMYRDEALIECTRLPSSICAALFKTDVRDDSQRDRLIGLLRRNPWYNPGGDGGKSGSGMPVFRLAGGFTGFGGKLCQKPRLVTDAEGILATDGKKNYRLFADFFGASLVREDLPEEPRSRVDAGNGLAAADSLVTFRGKQYRIPVELCVPVRDIVSYHTTVAMSSTLSYRIIVAGFPGAADES